MEDNPVGIQYDGISGHVEQHTRNEPMIVVDGDVSNDNEVHSFYITMFLIGFVFLCIIANICLSIKGSHDEKKKIKQIETKKKAIPPTNDIIINKNNPFLAEDV